jgi:hypothetical protein
MVYLRKKYPAVKFVNDWLDLREPKDLPRPFGIIGFSESTDFRTPPAVVS